MPEGAKQMLDARWLDSAETAAAALKDTAVLTQVAAHPDFGRLKRPWVNTWRLGDSDSAILARTLKDSGRFFIGLWALYLHATPGGLTRGRLAETLRENGISGAGRAGSALLYMRFIQYIEPGPDNGDRRVRRYVPTARMLEAFKARLHRHLTTLWPADPALLRIAPQFDREEVAGAYLAAIGEVTRLALRGYSSDPDSLDVFSQRYGGMALLAELMFAGPEEEAFPSMAPFAINLADLARRCRISRAQVRSALIAGHEAGLIELLPDNRCRLRPALNEHLDIFMASSIIGCAYAGRQAARQLDEIEQRRKA